MQRVALTGGIATGKSYVLARFAALGVPTIDADRVARDVVEPGEPAWSVLRVRFGPEMFRPDGRLDRSRLAALVFDDDHARMDLESIVHPPVRAAIDNWFRNPPGGKPFPFGIACIPLLFETGREGEFDRVIATACSAAQQLARLTARDGLAPGDGRKRLAAQLPTSVRTSAADYVIRTDDSFAETDRQVEQTYRELAAAAG